MAAPPLKIGQLVIADDALPHASVGHGGYQQVADKAEKERYPEILALMVALVLGDPEELTGDEPGDHKRRDDGKDDNYREKQPNRVHGHTHFQKGYITC